MNEKLNTQVTEGYTISVHLPRGYNNVKRYPVIYLNDGSDYLQDSLFIKKIKKSKFDNFIIVGIDSPDRESDFSPWYSNDLSYKFDSFNGNGDKYLDMLVTRIKAYVDDMYMTLKGFEHTIIVGASLGGLISMYAAIQYPKVFKYIGCISPSFWFEGFVEFVARNNVTNVSQGYHFTVGVKEGDRKMNVKRTMVESVHTIADILIYKDIENIYVELNNIYDHNKLSFQARLLEVMQWINEDIK